MSFSNQCKYRDGKLANWYHPSVLQNPCAPSATAEFGTRYIRFYNLVFSLGCSNRDMVVSALYVANLPESNKTCKSRSNDDSANAVVEKELCLVAKDEGLPSWDDPISIFFSVSVPNIDAEAYARRIFNYSQCSMACSVIAMNWFLEQEAFNLKLEVNAMHHQLIKHHLIPSKNTTDYYNPNLHYRPVEWNETKLNSYFTRLLSYIRAYSTGTNAYYDECYSRMYYAGVGGIANYTLNFPKLLSKSVIWNGKGKGSIRYALQVHQMKDKHTRKISRSSDRFAFRVLTFQSLLPSVGAASVIGNIANHDRTAASITSRPLTQMAGKVAADVSQSNAIFLFLGFVIIVLVILLCLGLRGHYDFGDGRQGRFYFAAGSRYSEPERLKSETV